MPVPSPMYKPGGSLKKFGTDSKAISGELPFALAGPLSFWENAGTEKPRTMRTARTRRNMPASNRELAHFIPRSRCTRGSLRRNLRYGKVEIERFGFQRFRPLA